MKRKNLLRWQLELYPNNHRDRRNLVIHILTVPLFLLGMVTLVAAPVAALLVDPRGWLLALGGLGPLAAVILQGRGHAREHEAPVPFAGTDDVIWRIMAEQWVTFPRFVVSGGFARAWRESASGKQEAS
jgi:hypothetical protein